MVILISILVTLIALALTQGFTEGHFFRWGFTVVSLKNFYFHLGLTFEPLQMTDNKGDVYDIKSLKLGFVFLIIWIDFYNHVGNTHLQDDTTVKPTTATI